MKFDVVRVNDLTASDIQTWSTLRRQTGLSSPFLSPHWALACAEVDGPDRRHAKVAILRDGPVSKAFLSARLSRFAAQPVGAPMCDYQGAVIAPGTSFCPRSAVRAFGVGRLDLQNLLAEQAVLGPFMRGKASSHVIDLSAGYDAYAAGRKAAGTDILQDCAKKRRKLEREHGEVVFTARSVEAGAFGQLIAWKRAQYAESKQTDIFEAGWTLDLLRTLFERPVGDLRGQLFTLHAGGRLAAAHYALCAGPVMHGWFIAHDDAFGRYSPGVVLIADMLKWAATQGVSELDLGPGDYRFKQSLANAKREVAYGFVGRASPATLVRAAAWRVRDAAEALPLGRVSALPGKAMRRMDVWRGLRGSWSLPR